MEVSGQTAEQVAEALRRGFEEPVAAYYGDKRILLRPQTVGFAVDAEANDRRGAGSATRSSASCAI